MTHGFTLFDTALGVAALAWGEGGVTAARLPEPDAAPVRERMSRRFRDAVEAVPPPAVAATVEGVIALLAGESVDLSQAPLDLGGCAPFEQSVYAIARAIPPGETLTYGEIAQRLGDRALARRVGQALGRNPIPILVPCHRVLAADGGAGGFSAPGGVATKMRLLAIERARSNPAPLLFDDLPLAVRRD